MKPMTARKYAGRAGHARTGMTTPALPPRSTRKWLPRLKAQVVAAVSEGLIALEEACERYALSPEEFRS